MLSKSELTRYSRHILLPEVRKAGQEKLKSSHVLVVGAGGLGSPVLLYLAAAGVGEITFIDHDTLDLTNLQRQVLYKTSDVDRAKVERAAEYLRELNPEIKLNPVRARVDPGNVKEYIAPADLIIETTDNFAAKFLLNDAAYFLKKPLVIGGILKFEGQMMAVNPGESACYRCLFEGPPPEGAVATCSEAGVLGAMAGMIGANQAIEALKILTEVGEPLYGKMLIARVLETEFRKIKIPRNPDCPLCGANPRITELSAEHYQGAPVETGGFSLESLR